MQDFGDRPRVAPERSGMRGRTIAALLAGCLLAGAVGAAWLGWRNGLIEFDVSEGVPQLVAAPSATPSATVAAVDTAAQAQLADTSAKVAMLEQRLADLNQQAIAASANATHAESLLLAFAARRALERGQPLGWIETQLRVRFGATQGAAVDRVIAAGAAPVTLAQLSEQFELLGPQLVGGTADEGTFDWLSRQVSELFVVRHDDMPSPAPESRLVRTRAFLAGGKVEAAAAEVERMPGHTAAADWLAHARDYTAAQRALDQLEAAALMSAQPVATPSAVPTVEASPSVE
ncbi:MAG: hypothetical protein ACKOVA_02520, partial [Novosphingobium sp.]